MKTEATKDVMEDLESHDASLVDTTCHACYAEFLDAEDLEIHIQRMHSCMDPKRCQFCTNTYTDMMNYAEHVRDHHFLDLKCCRFCTKVFLDKGKLKMHEKRHLSPESTYSCSQCNSMYPDMVLLELHERKHHDNDIDGCFLKCMPFLSLILNLKVVTLLQTLSKKKFVCASCKYVSHSLEIYKKHLKAKQCVGYACDNCSQHFKTKRYLIKHLQNTIRCSPIQEYVENLVTCTDCKKTIHPKSLQSHRKLCKALKCVDCEVICETIDELSEHQLKEHPLDMTLIRCSFCSKEYIGEAPMKKHITRAHKPSFHLYKYKCVDCNDIFKHPQKLFAHYFMKHKELEPFNCKICNKKFRIRKAFSLHIKLEHKSSGFVEFDEQYHVFFAASKSDNPFVPECVIPEEEMNEFESENEDPKQPKAFSIRTQLLNKDQKLLNNERKLLDTDTDATEADSADDKPVKRKLPPKKIKTKHPKKKMKKEPVLIYSSDDEPLLEIRKRVLQKKLNSRRNWTWKKNMVNKGKFICEVCQKNCYTYQNYYNHLSVHNKNQQVECVKCSKKFNSKTELTKHIKKEHASSKLTETLKNLLQKKKYDEPHTNATVTKKTPERFRINLKKVAIEKYVSPATIKAVETDLSVKNFLENFTPDINDSAKEKVEMESSVTIKSINGPLNIKPIIKLTKFKDEKYDKPATLKMPTRFKQQDNYPKTKITLKLVQEPERVNDFILPDYADNYPDNEDMNDHEDNKTDDIPEVAQEVSLDATEAPPLEDIPKILIPKMPKGYTKIHIATLQQEAPYFKIIKVDSETLHMVNKDMHIKEEATKKSDVIDLPGGTKLVTANPLAHLLGNTSVENILKPVKNKHYKPVIRDFQGMMAQAMQKLNETPPPKKKRQLKKYKGLE